MKRYKKRTIALCLASALTVIGAFGAENYDNTLMALRINVGTGGYVNLTAFTEKPYDAPIKTTKLDDNTFILTLKDTNSNASEPNIEKYDNIKSIQISTYPYTTESDGCTRIVVKTTGEPTLQAASALFIPDNIINENSQTSSSNHSYNDSEEADNYSPASNNEGENSETAAKSEKTSDFYTPPDYSNMQKSGGTQDYTIIVLCLFILMTIIGLIFMFSKDKMSSVVGEQGDIDIDNDNKKQNKSKNLKNTINKLDKAYSQTSGLSYNKNDEYTSDIQNNIATDEEEEEPNVVVDLDMLYQEAQKSPSDNLEETESDSGYDDLADLLNSFSTEEIPQEEPEEEEPFDEELYNSIINDKTLKLSSSDVEKINQLLQTELSEETYEELKNYVSTPKKKKLTQEQILEDLLSTYSIKQNIDFSEEDVKAIKKLMNVELGPDFVKDFTTNPVRTKVVAQKIKEGSGQKPHRTSEILTLNVKNMLPDLSQELKKQGNKTIKSEVKPSVVYYSQGYDYKKLKVSDELADITKSTNEEQNEHKPSYQPPIVDSGYEVSTLAIKDSLPNLDDFKVNPQKYEKKVEKPKADESALLKSLSNVTFKPFYEDVENELNQFDNFEIIKSYSFFKEQEQAAESTKEEPDIEKFFAKQIKNDNNAEKLMKLIETQQAARAKRKQAAEDAAAFKQELEAASKKKEIKSEKNQEPQNELYNFGGEYYTVLKTVKCSENSVCKIMQNNDKYVIIGRINERDFVLKQYESLNNSEMFIRQKSKNDNTKFLVKVGLHKFIIKVTENNMEFALDLC